MIKKKYKAGDKVKVTKYVGRKKTPHQTEGIIKHLTPLVVIGGERTAFVEYTDGGSGYHKLSSLKRIRWSMKK